MSREIKFRAWDVMKGNWMPMDDGECYYVPLSHVMDQSMIIEQFTGLKDKNGKEIYEGDIMRYDAIDYQVLWEDYYADFETKRLNSPWIPWDNAGYTLHFLASVGKVIGNIHENPELLGE